MRVWILGKERLLPLHEVFSVVWAEESGRSVLEAGLAEGSALLFAKTVNGGNKGSGNQKQQ